MWANSVETATSKYAARAKGGGRLDHRRFRIHPQARGTAITHTHAATSMARLAQAKGLGGAQNQAQKAAYKAGRTR